MISSLVDGLKVLRQCSIVISTYNLGIKMEVYLS